MIIIKKLPRCAIIFSLCFFSYEAMAVEACADLDENTVSCTFTNDSDTKTSGLAVTGNKVLFIAHEVTNGATKINTPISTQNGYLGIENAGGNIIGDISLNGNVNAQIVVIGGTITGDIDFSASNSGNTDIFLRSSNSTIDGDVTLSKSSGSTLYVYTNGTSVTGDINGGIATSGFLDIDDAPLNLNGTSELSITFTANGSIGNTAQLSQVRVGANDILDLATNDASLNSSTITMDRQISSGLTATINVGTGSIQGYAIGNGNINFHKDNTLTNQFGTFFDNSNSISLSIKDTADLIVDSGANPNVIDIDAGTIIVGEEADGDEAGSLTINANRSLKVANAIQLHDGAVLTLNNQSYVTGEIKGFSDDKGTVKINGAVTAKGAFGATSNSLNLIRLEANSSLDMDDNVVIASTIDLGNNSSLTVGSGVFNANAQGIEDGQGSITFEQNDENSLNKTLVGNLGEVGKTLENITVSEGTSLDAATNNVEIRATTLTLNNNSTLRIGTGTFAASVVSAADNDGTINIEGNNTLADSLGTDDNSIGTISVAEGKTLNAGTRDVYADNISLGSAASFTVGTGALKATIFDINDGTLNFGNTARSITGSFIGNGTSTINIGSATHAINGGLTLVEGDVLNVTVANSSTAGRINVSNAATISSNIDIRITVDLDNLSAASSDITLISAENGGELIEATAAENIYVNNSNQNSASNNAGTYTFTSVKTSADSSNIILRISFAELASSFSSPNQSLQDAFLAISGVSGATGNLSTIKNYIANAGNSNSAKAEVLQQISTNNIGINQNSFAIVNAVSSNIENRMDSIRQSDSSYSVSDISGNKVVGLDKNNTYALNKSKTISDASYDLETQKFGAWVQMIRSQATQGNQRGFSGYKSNLSGISFGVDKKISSDSLLGVGFAIASSSINAAANSKFTSIDTYQLNLYSEKSFGKFYVDGLIGAALNQYSSSKIISLVSSVAQADYDGYTYSAKVRAGYVHKLSNGLELYPELGTTYAYNMVDDYTETGAGTANLKVSSKNSQMLEVEPGIAAGYKMAVSKTSLSAGGLSIPAFVFNPKIKLSYGYDFIGNKQNSVANFVGQTTNFSTETSRVNRATTRVNIGINFYTLNAFTIGANYLLEHKKTYNSHTGALKFRYEF